MSEVILTINMVYNNHGLTKIQGGGGGSPTFATHCGKIAKAAAATAAFVVLMLRSISWEILF